MQTPSEMSELLENNAAMITVQRITEVINRRKKTCAFEGDGAAAAVSDIRAKIAGTEPVANSQLAVFVKWRFFCAKWRSTSSCEM
jgi:hypothetical protein